MDDLGELLGASPTMRMVKEKLRRILDRQREMGMGYWRANADRGQSRLG
jgi:hypothetical protein